MTDSYIIDDANLVDQRSEIHSVGSPKLFLKTHNEIERPLIQDEKSESCTIANVKALLTVKNSRPRIKGLYGPLKVPDKTRTALDVKNALIANTPFRSCDLLLVHGGKEVSDTTELCSDKGSTYVVLLRSTVTTLIPLQVKQGGLLAKDILQVPANTRIAKVKREIFSKKVSMLKPDSQQIIIGGRIANDHCIVGDFLLKQANANDKNKESTLTLFLSETMNVKHEVDVEIILRNKQKLKFSLEISKPLNAIRDFLAHEMRFPRNAPLMLSIRLPSTGSRKDLVELHPSYSLIDYGITNQWKSVEVCISKPPLDGNGMYVPMIPSEALKQPLHEVSDDEEGIQLSQLMQSLENGTFPWNLSETMNDAGMLAKPVAMSSMTPMASSSNAFEVKSVNSETKMKCDQKIASHSLNNVKNHNNNDISNNSNNNGNNNGNSSTSTSSVSNNSNSSKVNTNNNSGLKKGFLLSKTSEKSVKTTSNSDSNGSRVNNAISSDGNVSNVTSKKRSMETDLFGGMKKGFLLSGKQPSTKKTPSGEGTEAKDKTLS